MAKALKNEAKLPNPKTTYNEFPSDFNVPLSSLDKVRTQLRVIKKETQEDLKKNTSMLESIHQMHRDMAIDCENTLLSKEVRQVATGLSDLKSEIHAEKKVRRAVTNHLLQLVQDKSAEFDALFNHERREHEATRKRLKEVIRRTSFELKLLSAAK